MPMQDARAEAFDGTEVFLGPVPFMYLESVWSENPRAAAHQAVSRHFGDDGCRGDACFQRISVDDRTVRIVEPEMVAAVDEQIGGTKRLFEHRDGSLHRALRSGEDAFCIDVLCFGESPAVRCFCFDPGEGFLALLGRELF